MFPDWFAGVTFAAIGIGALIPAAVTSIAAANLLTRNIYKAHREAKGSHAMPQEQTEAPFAGLAVTPEPAPVPADGEGAPRWS